MPDFKEFLSEAGEKIISKILKPGRLYFVVDNKEIIQIADILFNKYKCRLSTATAQEIYRGIEVTYHFSNDKTGDYFCPRVIIPDNGLRRMNSVSPVVKGAEWIEREMSEMFGITFDGLKNPEPLLTGNHPEGLKTPWIHGREK